MRFPRRSPAAVDAPAGSLLAEQRKLRAEIATVREELQAALDQERRTEELRQREARMATASARRRELATRAGARVTERIERRAERRAAMHEAQAEAHALDAERKQANETERVAWLQARADASRLQATAWGSGSALRERADEALHRAPEPYVGEDGAPVDRRVRPAGYVVPGRVASEPARPEPSAVELPAAPERAVDGPGPAGPVAPEASSTGRRRRARVDVTALDVDQLNAALRGS